jgi:hypothetical protein
VYDKLDALMLNAANSTWDSKPTNEYQMLDTIISGTMIGAGKQLRKTTPF